MLECQGESLENLLAERIEDDVDEGEIHEYNLQDNEEDSANIQDNEDSSLGEKFYSLE